MKKYEMPESSKKLSELFKPADEMTNDELKSEIMEQQQKRIKKQDQFYERLELNEHDAVKANSTKNVKLILTNDPKLKGVFGWNDFTNQFIVLKDVPDLIIKKGEFKGRYRAMVTGYIEEKYHTLFKKDVFMDGLIQATAKNIINPIQELIKSVKWDGTPRVETWFIDYLGVKDTKYSRMATKRWLVGAVFRAFEPGKKFELVPVLTGKQGTGKSTLVESLCPDYFLDQLDELNGTNKDVLIKIASSWIIEIAELSAMNKSTIESTKAFISSKIDKFRPPYGGSLESVPRNSVLVGTSNDKEFLKDKTGNRRFLPMECNAKRRTKDPFNVKKEDVLQLLAEAYQLYKDGERVYLNDEETAMQTEAQKNNYVEDPLEDLITDYINMPVPKNWREWAVFQKRSAFEKYQDTGIVNNRKASKETNHDEIEPIPESELTTMKQVTSEEILRVVLNVQNKDISRISKGGDGKRVRLIMNNFVKEDTPGYWHTTNHIKKLDGKMARGWERN